MPRLSVVVPVHNVAPYLAECLDSILDQDAGDGPDLDVEVIAVDDASTDDSGTILDRYARRDARLTVVHKPVNGGLGAARNTGVELAAGDYVMFVDSDDTLAPGALARITHAALGDADVVMYGFVRAYPDGRREPDPRSVMALTPDDTVRMLDRPHLLDVFPSAWNKAVRLDFVRAHGFRFADGWYEDLPWTFPLLATAKTITTVAAPLYRYRQRTAGSILSTSGRRHLELFDRFDEVFDYLDAHPEAEPWRWRLFERLTRHVPTVLEARDRIPPDVRRDFYAAASQAFRRHRPAGWRARGAARWKVKLIERGDYRVFRAAQLANAAKRKVRG